MLFTTVCGSTSNVLQSEKATGYYEHGVRGGDDTGYLTDISDGSGGRWGETREEGKRSLRIDDL
jgi:hypothetical protein